VQADRKRDEGKRKAQGQDEENEENKENEERGGFWVSCTSGFAIVSREAFDTSLDRLTQPPKISLWCSKWDKALVLLAVEQAARKVGPILLLHRANFLLASLTPLNGLHN
jgi:hypothetical protein